MSEITITENNSLDNTVAMLDNLSQESTGIHSKLIRAQINTLRIVQNPTLLESSVDTILDHLHQAVEMASTEQEKKMAKQEACLILQSIIFYFHAKLLSEKAQTRKKALEMMRVSDQQITDAIKISATAILVANGLPVGDVAGMVPDSVKQKLTDVVTQGFSATTVKNNLQGAVAFVANLSNSKKAELTKSGNSFKLYNLFLENGNNQKLKREIYIMLDRVFEKLERNKSLIGNSVVLSELILTHHKELVNHFTKGDKRNSLIGSVFSGLSVVIFGVIFLVVLFIAFVIDSIASTHYYDSLHWYYILFAVLPAIYFYFKLKYKKRKLYSKYISISKSLRPNY